MGKNKVQRGSLPKSPSSKWKRQGSSAGPSFSRKAHTRVQPWHCQGLDSQRGGETCPGSEGRVIPVIPSPQSPPSAASPPSGRAGLSSNFQNGLHFLLLFRASNARIHYQIIQKCTPSKGIVPHDVPSKESHCHQQCFFSLDTHRPTLTRVTPHASFANPAICSFWYLLGIFSCQ